MTITVNEPALNTENYDYLNFGAVYRKDSKIFYKLAAFQEANKQVLNLSDTALTSPGAHDGAIVQVAQSASLTVQL